jgi:hypothetical protein
MSYKHPNAQAFPAEGGYTGLTKREWLIGMIASGQPDVPHFKRERSQSERVQSIVELADLLMRYSEEDRDE